MYHSLSSSNLLLLLLTSLEKLSAIEAFKMPEKGMIFPPVPSQLVILRPSPLLQWRLGALTALVCFLMLVVWSIDGCSIQSFVQPWRFNAYSVRISPSPSPFMSTKPNLVSEKPHRQNLTLMMAPRNLVPKKTNLTSNSTRVQFEWITAGSQKNFTANLMRGWLAPGGAPCREAKTVEISVPGVDGIDSVELTAGEIHEFKFQAIDESGKNVCIGGDYFETDISGENWKSRPPVKDFGNGTYSFSLQVHPEFAGDFNLTVILLFRHYQGLKFSTSRLGFDRKLRNVRLRFVKTPDVTLPELRSCKNLILTEMLGLDDGLGLGRMMSVRLAMTGVTAASLRISLAGNRGATVRLEL